MSVWLIRLSSVVMFAISGAVSILTFKSWAGLGPTNTVGLFVVLYLINGICLLVYVVMQIILVTNTLQDRWPLGDIAFGIFFFVIGQVILYVFSDEICNAIQHYLDGLFFATICNLLAVMMIYKVAQLDVTRVAERLTLCSTGIPSPRRISNLAWEPSRATGKSRSSCRKMSKGERCTTARTPNTPAACIPKRTDALRTMVYKRVHSELYTSANGFQT